MGQRKRADSDFEMQDPNAKISAVKAAQKFFSEDKDRAFEAKVCIVPTS